MAFGLLPVQVRIWPEKEVVVLVLEVENLDFSTHGQTLVRINQDLKHGGNIQGDEQIAQSRQVQAFAQFEQISFFECQGCEKGSAPVEPALVVFQQTETVKRAAFWQDEARVLHFLMPRERNAQRQVAEASFLAD